MRRAGLAGVLVASALLTGACSGRDPYAPLAKPEPVDPIDETTTTRPVGLGAVQLPGARGTTTTTVAIGPGDTTIVGRVEGPDGPVAGAIVRLERLVGDGMASIEVPTAADGTWNVSNALGGRYRIRAWQQPSLAMATAKVLFIDSTDPGAVELELDRYEGRRVEAVMAPDPPQVREPVNLKVRVADRVVDERGVIRTTPRPGISVRLTGTSSWFLLSPNPQTTGGDGSVTFRMECQDDGSQPLSVELDGAQVVPLDLPACVDPTAPPSTTTTEPTDDDDGASTTSTTSTTSP